MTIAVTIKVNDGLVFASDSATSMIRTADGGSVIVENVYNSANKIFNLLKGLPIAAITFGAGSIGDASISTLSKDLRRRFSGLDNKFLDWKIDASNYSIENIAQYAKKFLFEDKYASYFKDQDNSPFLGFWVGGYSANSEQSELYTIEISNNKCDGPHIRRPSNETGIDWAGEPEAITRLVLGHGSALPGLLCEMGIPTDRIPDAMAKIHATLQLPLAVPPMPIQDAIDLAHFLVETTIQFTRFKPGAATVGGPVELGVVTKHEGFKWVKRKHYFDATLNPGV